MYIKLNKTHKDNERKCHEVIEVKILYVDGVITQGNNVRKMEMTFQVAPPLQ